MTRFFFLVRLHNSHELQPQIRGARRSKKSLVGVVTPLRQPPAVSALSWHSAINLRPRRQRSGIEFWCLGRRRAHWVNGSAPPPRHCALSTLLTAAPSPSVARPVCPCYVHNISAAHQPKRMSCPAHFNGSEGAGECEMRYSTKIGTSTL